MGKICFNLQAMTGESYTKLNKAVNKIREYPDDFTGLRGFDICASEENMEKLFRAILEDD